jgi:CRP-like cAMP-binding protein
MKGCRIVLVPHGEYVYQKGEMALEMYFILEGVVEIEGDGTIYNVELKKSDFFGEECLTENRLTRHQSIRANKDLWLARVDMQKFESLLEIYPKMIEVIRTQSKRKYHLLKSKNQIAELMQSKNKKIPNGSPKSGINKIVPLNF